jgi:Domain of Unknown Function (DUF1259)
MHSWRRLSRSALAMVLLAGLPASAQDMPADYQAVLSLEKTGDFKDGVLKVNLPRNDLRVTIGQRPAPTPFGFGGCVAFTKGEGMDVMMGDLVLVEDEDNPVMSAVLQHGLEVALHSYFFLGTAAYLLHARDGRRRRPRGNGINVVAIHHHMTGVTPNVIFLHYHGTGPAATLARAVRGAVDHLAQNRPVGVEVQSAQGPGRVRYGEKEQRGAYRGQMTAYLRLIGATVPSIYGPSANDRTFG